ncbi:anthranilate synthase component I [Pontibacillus litoralis]|uniref:Anthranilate synthase component 1 n=1 Tax=Pontibacillus litoralis JSM 072002 TaxID=1385512 RepID=A0A0A5G7Z0_9BACI|nr:anthranilate synthase component I [Pontibacillus litoralis]KGX88149.1 anthranilate synthase subunit I [Pontibacillus litoralis JSM 072002]
MKDFPHFLQESYAYRTVPLTYQVYSDTLTPIQLYEQLREDAVYLLESGDPTSSWSRYSFIGLHPFITIEERAGQITIFDKDNQSERFAATIQQAFDDTFRQLQVLLPATPLPFQGGGVGFVSYDAISDMEKVDVHLANDMNMPHYHFLFCRTLLVFDHEQHTLDIIHFVRLQEDDGDDARFIRYEEGVRHIEEIIKKLREKKPSVCLFSAREYHSIPIEKVTTNYPKQDFVRDVEVLKNYIRAGDIFQAVLSQRFSKRVSVDGLQLYRVLRRRNPSPYMFYLTYQGYEIIGSSPERLIRVRHNEMEIHPIAGTRRRGATREEDDQFAKELMHDEKELAEHFMLVDLARNDIGRVASYGSVHVPVLTEVTRFSQVMHIISKVTGELREGIHPIEAFQAAFPAGTLSGAPKIRAMEILQQLEPTARNVYGGGIVYFGYDGTLDSCIAIRTIVLKDQVAYVQAGAGIVADSNPIKEWEETVNKAKALLQTIDDAEQLFRDENEVQQYA